MGDASKTHPPTSKRGNAHHRKPRAQHAQDLPEDDRSRRRDVAQRHIERVRRVHSGGSPFRRFAQAVSAAVGRPWAFVIATAVIVGWGVTGPLFDFSDTWQLIINTGTTIVTFLMVFLIQNTQNRDTEALRLKLDELILATQAARKEFVAIEDLADDELRELEDDLKGRSQTGGPDTSPDRRHVK